MNPSDPSPASTEDRVRQLSAELALTQSRLEHVLANGNRGLWDWDLVHDTFYVSPKLLRQSGESEATWSSMPAWQSRLHPNDRPRVENELAEFIAGRTDRFESSFKLQHSLGQYRKYLASGKLFRDPEGAPLRMICTLDDFTSQDEMERRFRGIFDNTFQFMGVLSKEGIILDCNRSSLASAGVEPHEVMNRPFWETPWWTHSPTQQQRLCEAIQKAARGEMDRFLATHPTPDGRLIHVDFSVKPVFDDEGNVLFLLPEGRDVTELQLAETELRSAEAKLAVAAQVANIGVWDWDVVADQVFVSPEYRSQIGVNDTHPWTYDRFINRLHEDDRRDVDFAVRQHFSGELPQYNVTFRLRHADGSYRWIEARGQLLRDQYQQPQRMIGVHLDVTEKKNAQDQLEQTVAALARSNTDLEQFAYVASHDLQEPLRAVAVYCQFLEKDYADRLDDEGRRYIQVTVRAARRMKMLIDDLLQLSRVGRDEPSFALVPMEEVMAEATDRLQAAIQEANALLQVETLPVVRGNRGRLVQLFQNLIGNAIKYAGPERPQIHVRAMETPSVWRFEVRDNGIGIPPEHHDEIFRVFRRLHDRKKIEGTGIGLAICRKIADLHRGRIWCEATAPPGALFCVELPKA